MNRHLLVFSIKILTLQKRDVIFTTPLLQEPVSRLRQSHYVTEDIFSEFEFEQKWGQKSPFTIADR